MITLSDGATTLELPNALEWPDENWTAERVSITPSVTGARIIQSGTLQTGRPITLQSPAPDIGVVSWETRQQLLAWSNTPDLLMTLTLNDGTEYTVEFRYDGDQPPLQFTALGDMPVRRPGTWWSVVIRLIEA